MSGLRHVIDAVVDAVADVTDGFLASGFLHAAEHHARRQSDDARRHRRHDHDVILWLLRGFMMWLKNHWSGEARERIEIRRKLLTLDALIATAVGMIADGLIAPPVDWFKIDHLRIEDWLVSQAPIAPRSSRRRCALRELVFGRTAGVGAGTCLHYTLRMLTYRGAFAYAIKPEC